MRHSTRATLILLLAAILPASPALAQASGGADDGGKTPSIATDPSEQTGQAGWSLRPDGPLPPPPPAVVTSPGPGTGGSAEFADWAVAVVAADWRSSQGAPIQAFENARRDLTYAFQRAGFDADNTASVSLAPRANGAPMASGAAQAAIEAVTRRANGGCLLYFTSHGSPAGMVWGDEGLLAPNRLDQLVDGWCQSRPTVVVVSACFSGVFVPALAQPNRMIMTAARRDRSSFGCSEDDTHPYFDACILESLGGAHDFIDLSMRSTACVNRREREEGLRPPSEPQTYVGAQMQSLLPFLRFQSP